REEPEHGFALFLVQFDARTPLGLAQARGVRPRPHGAGAQYVREIPRELGLAVREVREVDAVQVAAFAVDDDLADLLRIRERGAQDGFGHRAREQLGALLHEATARE